MPRRTSLLLVVVAALALPGAADPGSERTPKRVPRLVFPVVGAATYSDDYGAPRGRSRHGGIDIMAARRAVAVAVEAGIVTFHTTSARAGCMLYLRGDSGTEYLYVHLNNDLTARNDNRGRCVPGVAYAHRLKSGARVRAGQPVGYVGNSGDADATAPHLHFEVHPGGSAAVNPYRHLKRARKLLFPVTGARLVSLTLRGRLVAADRASLRIRVAVVRRWPGGLRVAKVGRTLELFLPETAIVVDSLGGLVRPSALRRVKRGLPAVVRTDPVPATLDAALGLPLALSVQTALLEP